MPLNSTDILQKLLQNAANGPPEPACYEVIQALSLGRDPIRECSADALGIFYRRLGIDQVAPEVGLEVSYSIRAESSTLYELAVRIWTSTRNTNTGLLLGIENNVVS